MANQSLGKTIIAGGAVSTLGNIFHKFTVLGSTFIILRYVPLYDYGLWQLILGLIGLVGLVILPGVEDIIISYVSRLISKHEYAAARTVFKQFSFILLALSVVATGLFLITPLFLIQFTGIFLEEVLVVVALYFPFYAFQRIIVTFFYIQLDYKAVQRVQIFSRIVYVCLLVGLLLVGDSAMAGIAYAFAVTPLIVSIVFAFPFFKHFRAQSLNGDPARVGIWHVLRGHGKWGILSNYFNHFLQSIRPWVLGFFIGIEGVAIVSVAQALLGEFSSLVPLNQVLGPAFSRHIHKTGEVRSVLARGIHYALLIYGLAALCVMIVSYPLISILFPKYMASIPLFTLMLIVAPALPLLAITIKLYYANLLQKELFLVSLFPKIVDIPLLVSLVYVFGVWGVAIERVISYYLTVIYRIYGIKKYMPQIDVFDRKILKTQYSKRDIAYIKVKLAELVSK